MCTIPSCTWNTCCGSAFLPTPFRNVYQPVRSFPLNSGVHCSLGCVAGAAFAMNVRHPTAKTQATKRIFIGAIVLLNLRFTLPPLKHRHRLSNSVELEESTIGFKPAPDRRPLVPEPLPVRLLTVEDAQLVTAAGL